MPWVYCVNDVGGEVLAVYHGRQTKRPFPNCTLPPTERRVFMYPMEFRSYGPDGVNVVYERDGQGAMVKRFYVLDYQGSV